MARLSKPTFSEDSRLARYIPEESRLAGGRAAVAAFEADHLTSAIPVQNSHLSVNSTEVETLKDIANYHRLNWQGGRGKAALAVHKVFDYSEAAKKAGVGVWYDHASATWEFIDFSSKAAEAYRHRPVTPNASNSLGSSSHCGVEFVRAFDQYKSTQFARRLASKGKFHLVCGETLRSDIRRPGGDRADRY